MKMTIEQLQYICMVAKTHSITVAADQLYVTQQTISKAINKLERELNVILLVRSHKGVSLTPEGEIFVDQAQEIIDKVEKLYFTMCPGLKDKQQEGVLKFDMTSYELTLIGSMLFSVFHKKYPKIQLRIVERLTRDTIMRFLNCEEGVGLVSVLEGDTGVGKISDLKSKLEIKILYLDELQIFVAPTSRFARKSEIGFDELKGLYAGYGSTPFMADIMERRYGVKTSVFTNSNSVSLIGQAIKEEMAFGVTTKGIAKRDPLYKDYVLLSLNDHPKIQVCFLYSKKYQTNTLEEILLFELEYIFSKM